MWQSTAPPKLLKFISKIKLLLNYLSRLVILLRPISCLLLFTLSVLGVLPFQTEKLFLVNHVIINEKKNLIIFGQNLKIPTIVKAPYCFANEIYKQIYFLIDSKW